MNASAHAARRGLYLITPDEPDTARLLARVAAVLDAGPAWLQYRNKAASPALRRQQARELLELSRRRGVPLIINDDWRLAADLGADGAHLGADDGDIGAARHAMGDDALIGATCHDSLERAVRACDDGASYLAFGAFFPSGTKPLARRAELDVLRQAARFGRPRVAIGGLTPDNAGSVLAAGADLVAVIAAVFAADDPAQAARAFTALFDSRNDPSTP